MSGTILSILQVLACLVVHDNSLRWALYSSNFREGNGEVRTLAGGCTAVPAEMHEVAS